MNNNNNNYQHPAMKNDGVDNMNTQHFSDAYIQAEQSNSQRPIESSQPALNPNGNIPSINYGTGTPDARDGGYIQAHLRGDTPQAGTVLTDNYYNVTDAGVHQVYEYSHNSSSQAELRAKQAEQRARQTGRSIYQQAPTSGGFEPYVDVSEPPKPNATQLEELRQQERYRTLKSRIRNLELDVNTQEIKLSRTRSILASLKAKLEEIEN